MRHGDDRGRARMVVSLVLAGGFVLLHGISALAIAIT
jgi:hypothetical protein